MGNKITIRAATNNDLDFLNRVMASSKAYWGYDTNFMKKFMENFKLTKDYISEKNTFIASLNGQDIGWYSFSINAENQLELDNLFLQPAYIGKGIGKLIWNSCVSTARTYDDPFFILWSDPNAEGFYQNMGCLKIGKRKSPMMPNRYPAIFRYDLN